MIRIAALALPLCAALPAAAADFTFHVPLILQTYHQPDSVVGSTHSVVCVVSGGGREIGRGKTPMGMPADGNLSTTIHVEVNARAPARAADATDYRCTFNVSDTVTADYAVTHGDLRPRPGTTPVLVVSGHITR
jgi:hypothetical protein